MLIITESIEQILEVAKTYENILDADQLLELHISDNELKDISKKLKKQLAIVKRISINSSSTNKPLNPERIQSDCKEIRELENAIRMLKDVGAE
ncbi:MAG TPA: hypothetical protein DEP72_06385 [Clostridiales bacterium]|nr:hypothetical protein [Clostridiales bacterium]